MSKRSNDYPIMPEGWHSVTPRVVAHNAQQLVEFIKHVFLATGDYRSDMPTIMKIGDSLIMVSDAGTRSPMTSFLYVYVASADEAYRRAIEAGAISLEEPSSVGYGDRRAMVQDKWGNTWQIATYIAVDKRK